MHKTAVTVANVRKADRTTVQPRLPGQRRLEELATKIISKKKSNKTKTIKCTDKIKGNLNSSESSNGTKIRCKRGKNIVINLLNKIKKKKKQS